MKTGILENPRGIMYGAGPLLMRRCIDCGTEYLHLDNKTICNGKEITRCPWCRPDSKPWTNGRGI